MNALEIKDLKLKNGSFEFGEMTLTLPGGCIMGLVGENGAGKTTLIYLILDIFHKDRGSVLIFGRKKNLNLTKQEIGVVTDEVGIPQCMTAKQVGKMMKHTFSHWNDAEYTRLLQKLSVPENTAFERFSRGMKTKLGIAIALSHNAKLLILDEPMNGLDPIARDEVLTLLYEFTRDETHSVLISSHLVGDLEKLCDYIAFLHKGKLLLCEEKDALLEEYGMIHCSAEELSAMDQNTVKYKRETPYGMDVIMARREIPSEYTVTPITIEELFVFMAKEEVQ
ncbi:MAG: ABC transporter ATP-binding protein [Clostridia bacterium]|nr:ABC transporter ATP-binding protein [Clostridia bacterium]